MSQNEDDLSLMARTLRLVNAAREVLGYKPISEMPKGVREECETCPLARALTEGEMLVRVTNTSARFLYHSTEVSEKVARAWATRVVPLTGRWAVVELPHALRTFVEEFDMKHIPALVEPGDEDEYEDEEDDE